MSTRNEELKALAEETSKSKAKVSAVVVQLGESSRRERQHAASLINQIAQMNADRLVPHIPELIDALNRPEAQTRWECLETLTLLIEHDSRTCSKALPDAETALFDEESGPVRLAAVRFLCKYGATTTSRSEKVWPLIDESIQCYHGDLEFNDMLLAIIDFSAGKLSPQVKTELHDRMSFDATNGKGSLQRRAQQILNNLK